MLQFNEIPARAEALVIFRRLLDDPVVKAFLALADAPDALRPGRYAAFAHLLFAHGENFTDYLWRLTALDENFYVKKRAKRETISPALAECLARELEFLQRMATTAPGEAKAGGQLFLPDWEIDPALDFRAAYEARMGRIFTDGYGIYADSAMFAYRAGEILPVGVPDPIRLSNLTGYGDERQRLLTNTLAFWQDRPVANALLYGDAGTGKSSTVKAIVNEFAHRGLRLVEIRKGDLLEIPHVAARLAENPLKFILFIDDLSFAQGSEEIGALKAVLEGSVASKTANVAIYATSNRRHLVKETFSERSGDDIHRNETIQEQTSLSERFGLSILFAKPNKADYLEIVSALAAARGLACTEDLPLLAEQFAIARGGRSGRTARQFIDQLARNQ